MPICPALPLSLNGKAHAAGNMSAHKDGDERIMRFSLAWIFIWCQPRPQECVVELHDRRVRSGILTKLAMRKVSGLATLAQAAPRLKRHMYQVVPGTLLR